MSAEPAGLLAPCCLKRKRPLKIEIPTVLRDIQPDKLNEATPRTDSTISSDYVGVFSVKGKKKFMEDAHKIVFPSSKDHLNEAFFGVYDGHGGRKAANFVARNLHDNIFEMMNSCTNFVKKEEAIKAAFLKTDQDFLNLGFSSGACCVTALIQGQEVIVSNLGDCRAVLSRCGVAEAVTEDHRVEHEDERKRIENKGGYVEIHRGSWRVHGVLSVSRSIGDYHLKDWVLAEPDSKVLLLSQDMEFLVLASDGLWEKVGNQETIDIVKQLCSRARNSRQSSIDCVNGSVNTSNSSKLQKDSIVRKHKGVSLSQSPGFCGEDYACENGSPNSKSRRTSLDTKVKLKRGSDSPTKENSGCYRKRPTSNKLVAACKELVDLALSRGSLDDITVMIIDLSHFRCNSQSI